MYALVFLFLFLSQPEEEEYYYGYEAFYPVRAFHLGSWMPQTEPVKTGIGNGFTMGLDYRARSISGLGVNAAVDLIIKNQDNVHESKSMVGTTYIIPVGIDLTFGIKTGSLLIPYAGTGVSLALAWLCLNDNNYTQQISGTSIGLNFIAGTDILFNRKKRSRLFLEGRLNMNTTSVELENDYMQYKKGQANLNLHGLSIVLGAGF
jgi:hypothetical protein